MFPESARCAQSFTRCASHVHTTMSFTKRHRRRIDAKQVFRGAILETQGQFRETIQLGVLIALKFQEQSSECTLFGSAFAQN